jgi:hypothetical protein
MDILASFSKIEEERSGILPLPGLISQAEQMYNLDAYPPSPGASDFDTKSDQSSRSLLIIFVKFM